MKEIFEIFLGC